MSAIDFRSIRYTTAGLECYYLGQRTSGDQVLHRFAIVNDVSEVFCYYNEKGQRIEYVAPGRWVVTSTGHQIIAPPKIVEVTRWITYHLYAHGDIGCRYHSDEPDIERFNDLVGTQKVVKSFEVPNDRR